VADQREIAVLRALGSSARQEILHLLGRGPATSAMLARALSSNTGVMSYHLRELGKAGIIEPDEQRGRARYWRLARADIRFHDSQVSPDPLAAQHAIDRRLTEFSAAIAHYWQRDDLEPLWRKASVFSVSPSVLTPDELAAFGREYLALLRRWSGRTSTEPTARPVRLALFAFPDADPLPAGHRPDEPPAGKRPATKPGRRRSTPKGQP
jgi:DNA-binding transcriptional ArsR family regulator